MLCKSCNFGKPIPVRDVTDMGFLEVLKAVGGQKTRRRLDGKLIETKDGRVLLKGRAPFCTELYCPSCGKFIQR